MQLCGHILEKRITEPQGGNKVQREGWVVLLLK